MKRFQDEAMRLAQSQCKLKMRLALEVTDLR